MLRRTRWLALALAAMLALICALPALAEETPMEFQTMVGKLMAEGHEPALIASAAMRLLFERDDASLCDIETDRKARDNGGYRRMLITIGRRQGAAPNHIVSAVAGRANIPGGRIGKIEIYDDYSVIAIPADAMDEVLDSMYGAKVCGRPVKARAFTEKPQGSRHSSVHGQHGHGRDMSRRSFSGGRGDSHARSQHKPFSRRRG